ncbi:MAG: hypothetical protein GY846_16500 [Deltaproteobacteria bacterium]|nr:hypothetical protein [Deltaproteobacteria bacterium]
MNELTKTVLVVDDKILIRKKFMEYFEDHLRRPLAAESGEQALNILENTPRRHGGHGKTGGLR